MSDIQNIQITGTQTNPSPKPHTTYTIQISTPIRTWTVSRRYNDFVSLHAELVSATGKEPPQPLPTKHGWSLTRSVYDEKMIRERRTLLESYLRTILTTRDPTHRQAYTFLDFLSYPSHHPAASSSSSSAAANPSSTSSSTIPPAPQNWTPANWLSEHGNLVSLLRQARAALLKRDALAGMGDPAGSRGAGVEARRMLKDLGGRVAGLEAGLKSVEKGLGEGEKRRREEMLEALRQERGDLQRMAEAGVRTAWQSTTTTRSDNASPSAGGMPGGLASLQPAGRVFGRPQARPQETAETRPLDDRGVLQLQQTQISGQDEQLAQLSKVLQRQRRMGEEIHQEIGEQTEMLEDLERGVDRTGGKLGKAKRGMNRLGK